MYKMLFWVFFCGVVFLSVSPWQIKVYSSFPDVFFSNYGFPQHVAGYFLLSFSACRIFKRANPWMLLGGILGMGIVLECIQYIVPNRSFNMYDLMGNLLGVLPVAVTVFFYQIRRAKYGNI